MVICKSIVIFSRQDEITLVLAVIVMVLYGLFLVDHKFPNSLISKLIGRFRSIFTLVVVVSTSLVLVFLIILTVIALFFK